jgi:hypothetical protein
VSTKLQGPPSELVEWLVAYTDRDGYRTATIVLARTAWLAHARVGHFLPGNPAFGDCKVGRIE